MSDITKPVVGASFPTWVDVKDRLPEEGSRVLATYTGVYGPRIVTFWKDGGHNPHFGRPDEADGKGSQPATHWHPIPMFLQEVKP